jgi:hypothetical protein
METVVGVEGNDEGKVEETGVEKGSSALSSPKQIADPVVYKLVRVYFFYHILNVCSYVCVCVYVIILLLMLFLFICKLKGKKLVSLVHEKCWIGVAWDVNTNERSFLLLLFYIKKMLLNMKGLFLCGILLSALEAAL